MAKTLRLRVFAGPNGSGKSTIINIVRDVTDKKSKPLEMGHYINADDIASSLHSNNFSFNTFNITPTRKQLLQFAETSGLLTGQFTANMFDRSFSFKKNKIKSTNSKTIAYLSQVIARYLREQMLLTKRSFSFETVFSHPSNLDIMRQAARAGYKVYLYFISTESPEINKYRVQVRVKQNGHDVPGDKIESRYYRALNLMYEAVSVSHKAYIFDNSGEQPYEIARIENRELKLKVPLSTTPEWFKKFYIYKPPAGTLPV